MAILAALVAASVAGRAVAGLGMEGLWIAPDEMIYGALGRSLWEDGSLRLFGGAPAVYSVLYPALVGLPLVTLGLDAGHDALKVVQPVVMSLAAVPVYFWSRRLAGAGWALLAAAFALAGPALVYTGLIMSETAFYPATAFAAWAMAAALERPTLARQALLVAAVLVAAATRLQGLVLVAAFAAAALLFGAFLRDRRRPLRLWPAFAAIGVLGAAWLGYRTAAVGSPTAALGAYSVVAERAYDPVEVARFAAYHAADILLFTGVVPLVALALLVVEAARGRGVTPALAAYLAVALSVLGSYLVVSAAFASEYVDRLAERTLIGVAPVLVVALAAWLERGAPRPRLATAAIVLLALALIVALPLRDLVADAAVPDAFTIVPLLWLREAAGDEALELTVWVGAAAALALLALLPRRAVPLVAVLGLAWLSFASFAATREVAQRVAFDQRFLLGGERSWIDREGEGPVAYLYAGEPVNLVWHELFWNERIERVFVLEGERPLEGLTLTLTAGVRPDGALVLPDGSAVDNRAIVARTELNLHGEPVAGIELQEYPVNGLRLWRVEPPARLSWFTQNVRQDGDMYEPGRVTAYDCQTGRLELTLLWKESTRVDLRVNGRTQTLERAGEEFVNTTVFPPPEADVCRFEIAGTSLLGSTRVEFVRE